MPVAVMLPPGDSAGDSRHPNCSFLLAFSLLWFLLFLCLLSIRHIRTRPYTPKTTDEVEQPLFGPPCYFVAAHGQPRGKELGVR